MRSCQREQDDRGFSFRPFERPAPEEESVIFWSHLTVTERTINYHIAARRLASAQSKEESNNITAPAEDDEDDLEQVCEPIPETMLK